MHLTRLTACGPGTPHRPKQWAEQSDYDTKKKHLNTLFIALLKPSSVKSYFLNRILIQISISFHPDVRPVGHFFLYVNIRVKFSSTLELEIYREELGKNAKHFSAYCRGNGDELIRQFILISYWNSSFWNSFEILSFLRRVQRTFWHHGAL